VRTWPPPRTRQLRARKGQQGTGVDREGGYAAAAVRIGTLLAAWPSPLPLEGLALRKELIARLCRTNARSGAAAWRGCAASRKSSSAMLPEQALGDASEACSSSRAHCARELLPPRRGPDGNRIAASRVSSPRPSSARLVRVLLRAELTRSIQAEVRGEANGRERQARASAVALPHADASAQHCSRSPLLRGGLRSLIGGQQAQTQQPRNAPTDPQAGVRP